MTDLPQKLLLYPQSFLSPEKVVKVFPLVSKIVFLKLSKTEDLIENIYKDLPIFWKEKITFLEFKKEIKIDWNQLSREVDVIEEWGLNFRTPETLKYFSQFKETLEDSLENIYPSFNKKEEKTKEETEIKRALILLCLAEKLDYRLYEIEKSLKEMENRYNQIFEEKIIGEDETFEKILDIKEPLTNYLFEEELPNLNLRIFAWKLIGKYLDWESLYSLNDLLITEKKLLEDWKEKFIFEKEKFLNEEMEFYKFKASLSEILEIPENNFLKASSETGVLFLSL
ncbi:hypothetical protein TOPB45_1353 [Thermodesulfobacterium geofontis OPF15]|jgi:hypothetical protein|uniref:Uncharacterized protein n=1 Tax=Thermodesulfobacterium geofontis (strain OPF15) TaxID=795359 RepID=F8C4U0_THEGP|nr:hypothetical protein [Thermodesulfobacterium geofontis]AEH23434.1 hypothetical protein TOPB45_1353 [Thermodesulfobacterium geofontis OPF15]